MSGRSFDVLHLHEPVTPSAALLALWAADCPTVATFHAATPRSRVMQAAGPMLRTSLSKLTARVAVSESARRTAAQHTTSDITVVPNGVYVDSFSTATARHKWTGTVDSPTLAFVGRFDEPRKGFRVLSQALPTILSASPRARIFIAGRGNETAARRLLTPAVSAACSFLGPVSEQEKATLLSSVDLFVAPHTGGESFGVVVLEAMSAGTAILSSDIAPFVDLLDNGACGAIFGNCDPDDLAYQAAQLLNNPNRRARLIRQGSKKALTYDWSVVGDKVLSTYEHANGQLV